MSRAKIALKTVCDSLLMLAPMQATVHEALMFSASLRMAANIPRKVRVAFVEEVRALPTPNPSPAAASLRLPVPFASNSALLAPLLLDMVALRGSPHVKLVCKPCHSIARLHRKAP